MADAGLLSKGIQLTAWIRPKGRDNSRLINTQVHQIERAMLDTLREQLPDPEPQIASPLNMRLLNQAIKDLGFEHSNPNLLRNLLISCSRWAFWWRERINRC